MLVIQAWFILLVVECGFLAGLTELAQHDPNVYCKVSGMFATDPNWTQQSVTDVVQPCLDIFGMDRCQ